MIPYARQSIDQSDKDAVLEVLGSDFLTQGPKVPEFENAVCGYTGASFGVAVNSCTSALHIACLALGLGKGDYLWTTPLTFVASANCGLYCGGEIDFVDIDPVTRNIDVCLLKQKLELAEKSGSLPKILVVVHFCGLPADLKEIHVLSKRYQFKVIEDASHALGATYNDNPVGNCHYSDITVFSFHPVKPVTSGEGGMAVTNDRELAQNMRLFAGHGITRDPDLMTGEPEGDWYYQQVALGYNYRMSDIHAALGVSQLKHLKPFIQARQQIAVKYDKAFECLPLQLPTVPVDRKSAYHLYSVSLDANSTFSRKQLFDKLREKGIGVQVHYIPVHLQPYYQNKGFAKGDFPQAESFYDRAMSLPCFAHMTAAEQACVIDTIKDVVS